MLKPLLACVAAAGCVTAALTVTTPASNAASDAAPDHLSRAAAIASAKTNAKLPVGRIHLTLPGPAAPPGLLARRPAPAAATRRYNGPYASSPPRCSPTPTTSGATAATTDPATAGVDAHYGIATTWDFYKTTFGRNGIANDGKGARAFVHYGAYVNASWSDACFCMRYGDGDGSTT